MDERPKVGIGVLVVKDGKVLFGKRKNAHSDGHYSSPGGNLEYGESWEECAKREVLEETGMEIKNVRFVTVMNNIFEAEKKHYVSIIMRADYISGEPQVLEPNKCEGWDWYDWDNLPTPLFLTTMKLKKQGYNLIDGGYKNE